MNDYSLAPTLTWVFIGLIVVFLGIYAWNEMVEQRDSRPPTDVPLGGQPAASPWEVCAHCGHRVLPENMIRGWCADCREHHLACWVEYLQDEGHRMVLDEIMGGTLPMRGAAMLAIDTTTGEISVVADPEGPTPEEIAALHAAIADEEDEQEDHR